MCYKPLISGLTTPRKAFAEWDQLVPWWQLAIDFHGLAEDMPGYFFTPVATYGYRHGDVQQAELSHGGQPSSCRLRLRSAGEQDAWLFAYRLDIDL
jgi:hypothetical protein